MSFTHFDSMSAYKTMDSNLRDFLYVLVTKSADSSIRPLHYCHYPVAAGRLYEVMEDVCKMASDAFNGNLHWHGTWGEIGISSKFLAYAENVLKQAKEIASPIPNLSEFLILSFGDDDPGAEILKKFAGLDRFEICDSWGKNQLVIHSPTVEDIFWGMELKKLYEISKRYAEKVSRIDLTAFHNHLEELSMLFPVQYRELLKRDD